MNKDQKKNSLIIHGGGGHANSVADVALFNGIQQLIFIDPYADTSKQLFGFDVHAHIPNNFIAKNIIAIGNNQKRAQLFHHNKGNLTSLIAKDAYIGKDTRIGQGTFIGHGAYVGPNGHIGINNIINTNSIIEHDCMIGNHNHVSIGATIAGKCQLGDFVTIGANATLIDNIQICSHVTIGAGATVIGHVTEPGTYVGTPARKINP
jgi:UDP-N-acetylbacillosamine N-acetyltransferase